MGKIPNFTERERFVTPKTDCALIFQQDKEVYQLGFQVCWSWKYRVACHLNIGRSLWLYHAPLFQIFVHIFRLCNYKKGFWWLLIAVCRFKPIHGNPRKDSNIIGPSSRIVVVAASFYWSHLGKSFVKIICSNMSVRHNAADLAHKYPLTAKAVDFLCGWWSDWCGFH